MPKDISREEYQTDFPDGHESSLRREAWKEALDNRKFEIELYWKRAAYFWTFIAAAFAGFFVLQDSSDCILKFALSCLGFIFSLGWYFVNRGSKAWQQNWEMHVDLLENEISGPVYKTIISPRPYRLLIPTEAYPFSVSKINQILSLFVTAMWLIFVIRTTALAVRQGQLLSWEILGITALTAAGVYMLFTATTDWSDRSAEVKRRAYVD